MSIRMLFAGLLGLSLFAAPKAPAGENDSCPAQKCDREKGRTNPQKKTDKEGEIESKLHTNVTLNFTDAPLQQIIDDIRGLTDINIYVDQPALDQEGVSMERPVSVKLENVSLKSALNLTLKQVHLTYIIKDGVVQITSESARGRMGPSPIRSAIWSSRFQAWLTRLRSPAASTTSAPEERLIKLLTSTVEPRSWSDMGGAGTIDYHPLTKSLVINQAPDIQEQILDTLNSLRRQNNLQVALDVRFITVDETVADRVSAEFQGKDGSTLVAAADAPLRLAILDAAERSRLLEVVQGDRRTRVMQPPKPTIISGQSATTEAIEQKSFVTGVDIRTTSKGNPIIQYVVEEVPIGMHDGQANRLGRPAFRQREPEREPEQTG